MAVDIKSLVLNSLDCFAKGDKENLYRLLNRWTDEATDVLQLWAILSYCNRSYPLPETRYGPFSSRDLDIKGLPDGFPAIIMSTLRALNYASPTLVAKVIFDTIG